ncbi:olfactory receptor 5AP2-like [Melanerpes formicivorus]|uniref:olfactory receptor 5AP2-like n=1 Tax=Melanerpes formicivorus TaxID=211600 RepID=UPI00358F5E47
MAGNDSQGGFLLLGITDSPRGQSLLFGLFLLIYVVTLLGNIGLMVLVWLVPSLHTPMYFFLTHLSFSDVCNSTVISPKMLTALWSGKKTISFAACVTQFHGFSLFATAECHLLAVMAYDRYVAVCKPLLYLPAFSGRVCWQLVASSYLLAFLSATIYTSCTFGGSFCGPQQIDHFFCDASPVLKLSCSATRGREKVISLLVALNGVATGTTILVSYICILCTVLRMSSAQSSSRAFKTCLSHLGAVSLYYGTIFFMYLQPVSSHGRRDKVVSIFYTVITPMLNPFIYSLRNKEVQGALVKCSSRVLNHCQHARVGAAPKGTDHLRWERHPSPQIFP